MAWTDLIGDALGAYSAIEQKKIDARIASTNLQAQELATAQYLTQQQAATEAAQKKTPAWLLPLGLVGLGLVVYMVAR